jgi:hypothetical protein
MLCTYATFFSAYLCENILFKQKINNLQELKRSILAKLLYNELQSPEGAASDNDGHSLSDSKKPYNQP